MDVHGEHSAYGAVGTRSDVTLVFLHASGWTRAMWLPQMEALRDEFRCIAVDLPCYGALRAQPFSLRAADGAITAAIAREDARRVIMVGSSLGGYIAMAFAYQHPERVAGLVLSGCSVAFEGHIGWLTRLCAVLYSVGCRGRVLTRLAERQRRFVSATYPPRTAEAVIAAGFYPQSWGQALFTLAREDVYAWLRAFPGPVLIANGERDHHNQRQASSQAAQASFARIEPIAGAGHMANLDRPEEFTRKLRTFAWEIAKGERAPRLQATHGGR